MIDRAALITSIEEEMEHAVSMGKQEQTRYSPDERVVDRAEERALTLQWARTIAVSEPDLLPRELVQAIVQVCSMLNLTFADYLVSRLRAAVTSDQGDWDERAERIGLAPPEESIDQRRAEREGQGSARRV